MSDGLSKSDAWEKVNRLARLEAAEDRKRAKRDADKKLQVGKRKRRKGGSSAAVRQRRRDAGQCPDCGKRPKKDRVYCGKCTQKKHSVGIPRRDKPENVRAARGRYYGDAKSTGRCVDCANDAEADRVRCSDCLEKARQRRREGVLTKMVRQVATGERRRELDLVDTGDYEDDVVIEIDSMWDEGQEPDSRPPSRRR